MCSVLPCPLPANVRAAVGAQVHCENNICCNNIWGVQDVLFPGLYLEGRQKHAVIALVPVPSIPSFLSAPAAEAEI